MDLSNPQPMQEGDKKFVLPRLPDRAADSHKGTFGRALLIGGSRGMAGAIAMSAMAAVRMGSGLTRVATPDCCLETVAGFSPCTMQLGLPCDDFGRLSQWSPELIDQLKATDCLAIGPGMGRSSSIDHCLRWLLEWLANNRADLPIVLDADALNTLAESGSYWQHLQLKLILTPHPGEWSRLSGSSAADRAQQVGTSIEFAKRFNSNLVIVLKGHQTLVTDGQVNTINRTGTPAMAVGGSGDVLTGVIAALVCQGLSPLQAAQLGVHLHGRAANLAQHTLQNHVVLPTELIEFLPRAYYETGQGMDFSFGPELLLNPSQI
jgi:NAD(P)H-hydrate epimerase